MEISNLEEHKQEAERTLAGEATGGEEPEQERAEIRKQESELAGETDDEGARDAAARDGEDVNLGRPGF